ncbi:MAG TPA: hypoxanthine phosphoribosyltransferase [Longimicrobiales bacterium]|nr:hypoxanthine phosphoribosyltransferase [Longimicrobiales bacterium]
MPHLTEDSQLGGQAIRRVVHSAEAIQARVRELAGDISRSFTAADRLLLVGTLKGSFVFLADLVRAIDLPLHVDFVLASSYGAGKVSTGEVRLLYDPSAELKGRAVILVEDIVDSGATLNRLIPRLEAREPTSLDVCTLLHKHLSPVDREPRWVGFDAPDEFLVGYGLDFAEDFRHLPYIASL